MGLFKKNCEYCDVKIGKGKEVFAEVKIPEFNGLQSAPFCSRRHARKYAEEVTGTKRTSFCPSCAV